MRFDDHEFGNFSTNLKLEVMKSYLEAYTQALKNQLFEICYIDAFAGTGVRTEHLDATDATLFESARESHIKRYPGSARLALEVSPPFDRLIFIEKNPRHVAALESLRTAYPSKPIEIRQGSANEEIQRLISTRSWRSTRAVMFLDPYGMEVDWITLQKIAETQAIDVWYLVSLSGLFRQAARNAKSLDKGKRTAITRMLGTSAWETEWYTSLNQEDLFDQPDDSRLRTAQVKQIEEFVRHRLSTVFAKVLDPLPLSNDRGVQTFSLFFAVSNRQPKAIGLATKIANHILNRGRSSQTRPR